MPVTPPAEECSRLALEAAGVGTWTWNIPGKQITWDSVTNALFGLEAGAFSGGEEEVEKLIHPDDRAHVRDHVQHCLVTGDEVSTEFRVIWPKDGSVHFLCARGKVARDGNGQYSRVTGASWETTERKAMEEELARERFLLHTLMENLPDRIYFKDLESRFVRVSHATLKRFEQPDPSHVIGKTDFDFYREEHARQAFEDEQRIIRTGIPLVNQEEKRETSVNGEVTWVSTTKLPLRDSSGRIIGTFGLSRDITDRRLAEEQLAKYAQELRRKNQELEEDLEMARELQNALIPRRYPCFPHDVSPPDSALHFSHVFNPSTAVSGDFFDILELSDSTAGIFICDVMGHGVRAALVASIIRALVRELTNVGEAPGEFLATLNRKLTGILKQTEIPMFASASYVVADVAKGELRYANAGHPDPLCVRHAASSNCATQLNPARRGPVLGMFEQAQYGTSQCGLSVQDKVILFTDGVFEVEGADGELYDQQCLMRAVNERVNLRGNDLCREVLAEIQEFSATHQFSDDVCMVAIEVERLGVA